ncbi:MAG TPA: PaaI family thioesterase [Acidimicrobiia bacterium]
MSEAAPGYPDEIAYVSPERARLAEAARALIDAVMTTPDATADQLTASASRIEATTLELVGDVDRMQRRDDTLRTHGDYLPRSPVVGQASPLAPGSIDWELVDDPAHEGWKRCVATGTLTAAYEGPPRFVHGGIVALFFDEILGIANIASGCPGMTGSLTVKYRRPTPLFQTLRWEGWVEEVHGRRVRSRATVHHGDVLCAEADGVFVQPRQELREAYFGADAAEAT